MNEEQQPKTSGMEVIIMLMVAVLFDVIGLFATLLDAAFGAGEFVKFFIDVVASAIIFFWATMKGMRSAWIVAGGVCELVPFVNTLPLYTVTMSIALYLDHHPKEAAVAEAVGPRVVNAKKIPKK